MAISPLITSNVFKGSNKIHPLSVSLNDMAGDKNDKLDDSIITSILSTDEKAPEQEFIDGDTRAWLIVVGSWVHTFFFYNPVQSWILSPAGWIFLVLLG